MDALRRGSVLFDYESRGRELKPQQFAVGDVLDARKSISAILMSRRTAKTESVLLWIFGMMDLNPGLRVAFTMATTREAARAKFLSDILPVMEAFAEVNDGVRLLRGAGYEHVTLKGSTFQVLAPLDRAFRSKEFDIIIIDESGEAAEDIKDTLLPAALPTMDTSWLGMLILMGTAGDYKAGNLLYEALHDPDASVLDHSTEDGQVDVSLLSDWDYAKAMLEVHHVGVGTLTTAEKLKMSWSLLSPERFAREYLGVWGTRGGEGGIFDAGDVVGATLPGDLPGPPRRFALALHADTTGRWAIVAAWREKDLAYALLLDHGTRVSAAAGRARELSRKYRTRLALDGWGNTVMMDVRQRIEQMRPGINIDVQTVQDLGAAYERFADDFIQGRLKVYDQDYMTASLMRVKRVQMGKYWKFQGMGDTDDATPAVAAAIALRQYDATVRDANTADTVAQHAVVTL